MLIEGLFEVVFIIFQILFLPIKLPGLSDVVYDFLAEISEYLGFGLYVLSAYTDLNYLISLLRIVVSVDIGILIYKIVMWIIRKIPMLGMS